MMIEPSGRCAKERKRVEIKDAERVRMSNGAAAWRGTCPSCGVPVWTLVAAGGQGASE
jgi:hypothetical protein